MEEMENVREKGERKKKRRGTNLGGEMTRHGRKIIKNQWLDHW